METHFPISLFVSGGVSVDNAWTMLMKPVESIGSSEELDAILWEDEEVALLEDAVRLEEAARLEEAGSADDEFAETSFDDELAETSLDEDSAEMLLDDELAEMPFEDAGSSSAMWMGELLDVLSQLIQHKAVAERNKFPKKLWIFLFISISKIRFQVRGSRREVWGFCP